MSRRIHPVIMSGGSGTRLWPVSRAAYPKQFTRLLNPDGRSLLGTTLTLLSTAEGFEPPTLSCNADHRFMIKEEADLAGVEARAILLEPVARNTAPAVAVAALSVARADPHAVMVVMPADHAIADPAGYVTAVRHAAELAETGRLVLFGIKPIEPNTGYGYICRGEQIKGVEFPAFTVERFAEKPKLEVAKQYLADGRYVWNSGVFVFLASAFIEELRALEPDMLAAAQAALDRSQSDLGFTRLDPAAFAKAKSISVDYAVMERTTKAAVLPLDIGWTDVGSWSAVWRLSPQDAHGNSGLGPRILEDTRNTYVYADRALVATLGVSNLVIVETPDAILVADKDRSQDVGTIVKRIKDSGRSEHEQHIVSHRPWGSFQTLNLGDRFQVKLLKVKPGGKLSMQMHHHRSEHWVVVRGTAKITVESTETLLRENESVYISATQWHRLENPGKFPLEIIEVQIGSYLGEDDIVRSDDVYNRAPHETK
jgi:mannose-1-phosphate guanylyltransferase/mannose-6-phosphate isomerase